MTLNIIIPPEHQSAPTGKYDPGLARETARIKDICEAARRDWDSFDAEMEAPGHSDPGLSQLRRAEGDPGAWVEENLELYERNCEKAKRQQLPGQERWEGRENEAARMVRILHPNAVMRKLRAAGVDARTEEHPNATLWLNDWTVAGLVGVNVWAAPQEMDEEGFLFALSQATTQRQKDLAHLNYMACREGRKIRKTLTSLQEPYGPEYSVMRFDERGVATKEKYRGWRTAMLVLIVAEILTEDQVDRAFGPAIGPAGAWYRAQLQVWRQIRLGKAI